MLARGAWICLHLSDIVKFNRPAHENILFTNDVLEFCSQQLKWRFEGLLGYCKQHFLTVSESRIRC